MSPKTQRIIDDLQTLTFEERQELLLYLKAQPELRWVEQIRLGENYSVTSENLESVESEAEYILAATKGSWGRQSLDDIDAELARQRFEDWGE